MIQILQIILILFQVIHMNELNNNFKIKLIYLKLVFNKGFEIP